MKYFKIKASRMAERYEVNSKEFTRHTDNKFPYVQSVSLDKQDNTKLVPIKDKEGNELENSEYKRLINNQYMNYQFRFTAHRQNAVDGSTLEEKMDFCIDDMRTNTEIYRRSITFDENYFMNIVKKTGNDKYRAQKLLEIAEKIMPPITIQN